MSSLQSPQSGATTTLPTHENPHDSAPGSEDNFGFEPQAAAVDTAPQSGASMDNCIEVKTECMQTDIDEGEVMPSLQSPQSGATVTLPTHENPHDSAPGSEDNFGFEPQAAAVDTAPQSSASMDNCIEVKTECMQTDIDEGAEPSTTRHHYQITKNIPPDVVYCMRGVRCKLCYDLFKGHKCVERLVEHTKLKHKSRASFKFLRQLHENNSPEKVVGEGMRYCTCEHCEFTRPYSIRKRVNCNRTRHK
jgi:hypothetical protein